MPLDTWWAFAVATFFISASPGPNMLHMMTSGIRHGLRPTLFTMAGCMSAVLSITSASAAGMGVLLEASPRLFDGLRILGAAYLMYLGIKNIRLPVDASIDTRTTADAHCRMSARSHFQSGFWVGFSNPKLLLFAAAFFPQFIDRTKPEFVQFILLLATFFCIELGWYMAYAIGGSRIAGALSRPKVQRAFNCVTGALFIAFGAALLAYRRA